MLQVCLPFCQWPTWDIIIAAMDRTRLTVNHHVDEKYGKLALDSIKQLERDRERKSYCFPISERGERNNDTKAADGWTSVTLNMKQHPEKIKKTWCCEWKLTVRNNNGSLKGQFKVVLFVLRRTFEGLQCQKVCDRAGEYWKRSWISWPFYVWLWAHTWGRQKTSGM